MALAITHNFVSPIVDQADPTLLGPDEWNDTHALSMATNKLLGRATAATGAIEEITLGTNLSFTGTTLNAASGSSSPGAPVNAIQFNNPLGTFAGDADFTWVAGSGLTNLQHAAFGNFAAIGSLNYSPGDGVNTVTIAQVVPFVIDEFVSADLSGVAAYGSEVILNAKHTGVGNAGAAIGGDFYTTVDSTNVGHITNGLGLGGAFTNYGSGDIPSIFGLKFQVLDFGSGAVRNIYGIFVDPQTYNPSLLDGMYGLRLATYADPSSGGITNAYAISIFSQGGGQKLTNNYGLHIEDLSGDGASGISENIHSAGASSLTKFEGHHYQGNYYETTEVTAPSAPPANGVRIYAQDNGGGKTQLMALFSSGAAQQIAIQP